MLPWRVCRVDLFAGAIGAIGSLIVVRLLTSSLMLASQLARVPHDDDDVGQVMIGLTLVVVLGGALAIAGYRLCKYSRESAWLWTSGALFGSVASVVWLR